MGVVRKGVGRNIPAFHLQPFGFPARRSGPGFVAGLSRLYARVIYAIIALVMIAAQLIDRLCVDGANVNCCGEPSIGFIKVFYQQSIYQTIGSGIVD